MTTLATNEHRRRASTLATLLELVRWLGQALSVRINGIMKTVGEISFAFGHQTVRASLDDRLRWRCDDHDAEAFLRDVCCWEPVSDSDRSYALRSLYQISHRLGAEVLVPQTSDA